MLEPHRAIFYNYKLENDACGILCTYSAEEKQFGGKQFEECILLNSVPYKESCNEKFRYICQGKNFHACINKLIMNTLSFKFVASYILISLVSHIDKRFILNVRL